MEKQLFGNLKKRDDLSPQELEIIKLKKLLKEEEEEKSELSLCQKYDLRTPVL